MSVDLKNIGNRPATQREKATMLPLALSALLSFILALALGASDVLVPAAAAHVAFAVGIVPLVFGALLHFVPVLTRSGPPHAVVRAMPFVAQGIGLLAVSVFQGWSPRWVLHVAAMFDALGAAAIFCWVVDRAQRCVGMPHPGWRWYAGSLATLVITLLAVPAMDGEYGHLARLLHMHLNTLGFVGLAALGTLPVLMPTVLGQTDLQAGWWLRTWWLRMFGGSLLLGAGVIVHPALAALGGAVLLWSAASLGWRWFKTFGLALLWRDGAATLLLTATFGYCLVLVLGALHGFGLLPARPAIAAFACLFLLPLVTGALTQLLPVWRYPGERNAARVALRARLAFGGQIRAICFILAGLAFAADWQLPGLVLAISGLLLFALVLLRPAR